MSLREQILQRKAPIAKIALPGGIEIYVKPLSVNKVRHLIALQKAIATNGDDMSNIELMIDWIIAAAVDESGVDAFTASDREAFLEQDTKFILELGNAVIKANTPTVEELEKNS